MQLDKSAAIDPLTTTNYHIVRQGGVLCITKTRWRCPQWVKNGKPRNEHIFSGLPRKQTFEVTGPSSAASTARPCSVSTKRDAA